MSEVNLNLFSLLNNSRIYLQRLCDAQGQSKYSSWNETRQVHNGNIKNREGCMFCYENICTCLPGKMLFNLPFTSRIFIGDEKRSDVTSFLGKEKWDVNGMECMRSWSILLWQFSSYTDILKWTEFGFCVSLCFVLWNLDYTTHSYYAIPALTELIQEFFEEQSCMETEFLDLTRVFDCLKPFIALYKK